MIRQYQKKDLEQIMDIWFDAQTIAHPFLSKDFVDKVKVMMMDMFIPNSKTWVYESKGEVIGFIAMMGHEIGGLFVNPTAQSKGIGSSLLKYMNNFHKTLEVEVFDENKIGKPFYLKQGFKTTREYTHKETQQKVLRMKYSSISKSQ